MIGEVGMFQMGTRRVKAGGGGWARAPSWNALQALLYIAAPSRKYRDICLVFSYFIICFSQYQQGGGISKLVWVVEGLDRESPLGAQIPSSPDVQHWLPYVPLCDSPEAELVCLGAGGKPAGFVLGVPPNSPQCDSDGSSVTWFAAPGSLVGVFFS